jgi:hypothetical protein
MPAPVGQFLFSAPSNCTTEEKVGSCSTEPGDGACCPCATSRMGKRHIASPKTANVESGTRISFVSFLHSAAQPRWTPNGPCQIWIGSRSWMPAACAGHQFWQTQLVDERRQKCVKILRVRRLKSMSEAGQEATSHHWSDMKSRYLSSKIRSACSLTIVLLGATIEGGELSFGRCSSVTSPGVLTIFLVVGLPLSALTGIKADYFGYAVAICWIAASVVAGVRAAWFPCPRCGKPFFASWWYRNPFARKCVHCGLPKWANSQMPSSS